MFLGNVAVHDLQSDGLMDFIVGQDSEGTHSRRMFVRRNCAAGFALGSSSSDWQKKSGRGCAIGVAAYGTLELAKAACDADVCQGIFDDGCDETGEYRLCTGPEHSLCSPVSI